MRVDSTLKSDIVDSIVSTGSCKCAKKTTQNKHCKLEYLTIIYSCQYA